MPDPVENLLRLIEELSAATEENRLQWAEAGSSTFLLSRPQGSVTIRSLDESGNSPYGFQLLSHEGAVLEELNELRENPRPWDRLLAQLYQVARADALSITKTLEAWFKDLRSGDLDLEQDPQDGFDHRELSGYPEYPRAHPDHYGYTEHPGNEFQVISATYRPIDGSSPGTDVTRTLAAKVVDGHLELTVSNAQLRVDPAPNKRKQLIIRWRMGENLFRAIAKEGETVSLPGLGGV